jgi:hypothetical protein
MNPPPSDIPWLDPVTFYENQRKIPTEELWRYAGQYVAWSWDGSRVVASDADEGELYRKLAEAGHELSRVVVTYVDPPDLVNL